jgi:hypothetical protein
MKRDAYASPNDLNILNGLNDLNDPAQETSSHAER